MIDALWPFIPENQHHLKENDQEMIRDYSEQQQLTKRSHELYGPLWIGATLIIELCILSHMVGALRLESKVNEGNREDIAMKFAN